MSSATLEQPKMWVPSDRDLSSLGRTRTGWSTLSRSGKIAGGDDDRIRMTQEELETVKRVVFKAETFERAEQIRISLLKLQCDRFSSEVKGDGVTSCVICAKALRGTTKSPPPSPVECMDCRKACMLRDVGSKSPPKSTDHDECEDCRKAVCSTCKAMYKEYSGNEVVLCSACFNERELWKKSGAWFTNSFPMVQILNKDKQKWLAQPQRSSGQQQQQLLGQPQQSPGQHNVTSNQEIQPFQVYQSSPQHTLNIHNGITQFPSITVTMDRSAFSSGGEIGQVKWPAEPHRSRSNSAASPRETPISERSRAMTGVSLPTEQTPPPANMRSGSLPRAFQKNPPTEATPINSVGSTPGDGTGLPHSESITIKTPSAAEPEEETDNISFDVYMSIGNT